ncbi:ATP-binding protein [Sorangium sp. So ce321]|uniref:ATP-binding protein n=1 Tax=Sorangium sp. So ce321 TaxID=3133300 RepID=UPI003F603A75
MDPTRAQPARLGPGTLASADPLPRAALVADLSKRHESRSVVITTNLSYKQWGTVFGDAPCLGALVDRFAQQCHVLDIDADSWRDKERLETKCRAPRPRRTPRG